jgi:hypothetical protein
MQSTHETDEGLDSIGRTQAMSATRSVCGAECWPESIRRRVGIASCMSGSSGESQTFQMALRLWWLWYTGWVTWKRKLSVLYEPLAELQGKLVQLIDSGKFGGAASRSELPAFATSFATPLSPPVESPPTQAPLPYLGVTSE